MTYVIETDEGRFEGETEGQAKRALRKARDAARKLARAEKAAHEIAKGRAECAGYRVLARLASPDPLPRGWEIVGCDHYAHTVAYANGGYTSVVETTDGRGSWTWAFEDASKILGALCDVTGYAFALFVDCDDANAFGVGVATIEGTDRTVVTLADLPGVTIERALAKGAFDKRTKYVPGFETIEGSKS